MLKAALGASLLALRVLAAPAPAAADPAADCNDASLQRAVAGCTALIDEGKLEPDQSGPSTSCCGFWFQAAS